MCADYYASKASTQAVFDLRVELYSQILRMSASFFDQNKSGAILALDWRRLVRKT